jgi:3',5'-cyclic AMP phosphodiesterase CpdA
MAELHAASPFDTVLLLGDNLYPDGDPAGLQEKFERPYAELLRSGMRFRAVLGNHDVKSGRSAQINYAPFNMGGRAYYSFAEAGGLVEFFALDSNAVDESQTAWLEGALAASKALWKIAFLHHPPYSSGMKHGSSMSLRSALEPLFVRHGVAAVFSGHDHVYERVRPQSGVQYFVSGAGGQLRRGGLDRSSPLFEAGDDQVNSFIYAEVTPDSLRFRAVGADGRTLDEGALAHVTGVAAANN